MATESLLSMKSLNEIRRAYKKGQKTVVIEKRAYTIRRKGDHLLIKPVEGKLPIANVQIEGGPTKKLQKWQESEPKVGDTRTTRRYQKRS